jgi:hypothetical protein
MGQTAEIGHDHAKTMIKRHGNADALGGGEPNGVTNEPAIIENIAMRQGRAFGLARGA